MKKFRHPKFAAAMHHRNGKMTTSSALTHQHSGSVGVPGSPYQDSVSATMESEYQALKSAMRLRTKTDMTWSTNGGQTHDGDDCGKNTSLGSHGGVASQYSSSNHLNGQASAINMQSQLRSTSKNAPQSFFQIKSNMKSTKSKRRNAPC